MRLIDYRPCFFTGLKCSPIGTRTFIEDEREKSNGNVCCRIATIDSLNLQVDNAINRIRSDEPRDEPTRICNQRQGYRLD